MIRTFLALLPLLALPGRVPARQEAAGSAPADAAELTRALLEKRDDADPELVRRLANLRTPEALDGLARFYDAVGSLYMRRIALRGFANFDGVAEAEARAMQELTDVATQASETELRETAIDELADCAAGRNALRAIVDSRADDAVRERALRHHAATARPEDAEWYQHVLGSEETRKKEKRGKAKDEPEEEPVYTNPLKEIAFEGLASSRTPAQLAEATESKLVGIRRRALEELAARRDEAAVECAEKRYEDGRERADVRLLAAEILLDAGGAKFAHELQKDAMRSNTPLELALGAADLLAALDDPKLRAQTVKDLTDGREREKRFRLRMAARISDPKVDKALLELSRDKERLVVVDALRAMGVRGNPTFVPRLEEVLAQSQDPLALGAAFEALDRIRGGDPAWRARLASQAAHPSEVVRNAALEALGRTQDPSALAPLVGALAHPDWTTRLAAARGLEALHVAEGVGALCARMEVESGRVASELSDVLWRLTAQPFRGDGRQWKRWWDAEGASFRFPSADELAKRRQERELREAKQVSRSFRGVQVDSRFFGLRIASHRVGFVIDVSGSMDWGLAGQDSTEGPRRMEIAKKELIACLEALEAGTQFNIYPFSDGVHPWKDEPVEATEASFQEAKQFVEELGAFGGTNIHGGLRAAFDDPTIDTVFFLSDGEPSTGEVVDPAAIREEVRNWNQGRGVIVHTISIGDRFPLLEWLAADSQGLYRTYP